MPERQLRLFPPAGPLVGRMGEEFFRAIPTSPGVYLMRDAAGKILYVGQSGNLRHRLFTYKNARPETASRRLIRLIHSVDRIELELCADHIEALLRENHLLRTHRPRFNSIHTYPQAYFFIELNLNSSELELKLTREPSDHAYGAFKTSAMYGFAALAMLLWNYLHRPVSLAAWPRRFLQARPAKQFSFVTANRSLLEAVPALRDFLDGAKIELLELFRAEVPPQTSRFEQGWYEHAFGTLEQFFKQGPERNRRLRQLHGVARSWIDKAELDDLIVKSAGSNPPKLKQPVPANAVG